LHENGRSIHTVYHFGFDTAHRIYVAAVCGPSYGVVVSILARQLSPARGTVRFLRVAPQPLGKILGCDFAAVQFFENHDALDGRERRGRLLLYNFLWKVVPGAGIESALSGSPQPLDMLAFPLFFGNLEHV
jgi:hypothetical protein